MDSSNRRTLQTLGALRALAALSRAWAQVRAVELRETPESRSQDLTVAETTLNVTAGPQSASRSTARCQARCCASGRATRW